MTDRFPRAPRLLDNTCIATHAIIESAQRVFLRETNNPINWVDLSTLVEAIILNDFVAFPATNTNYAEPLMKPLVEAHVLDIWWPEAGIFSIASTKEETWDKPEEFNIRAALLCGGWPDKNYENLSEVGRDAIDEIAARFATQALLSANQQTEANSILLWGLDARILDDETVDNRIIKTLLENSKKASSRKFGIYDTESIDEYQSYCRSMKNLANEYGTPLIRGAIEESIFDTNCLIETSQYTINNILNLELSKFSYQKIGKFTNLIPTPAFANIVFSRAKNLEDIIPISLEIRDEFKGYIKTIRDHKNAYRELLAKENISVANNLTKIEDSFRKSVVANIRNLNDKQETTIKRIFDFISGFIFAAEDAFEGKTFSLLSKFTDPLKIAIEDSLYINYGGVYEVMNKVPQMEQIGASVHRLVGKKIDERGVLALTNSGKILNAEYDLDISKKSFSSNSSHTAESPRVKARDDDSELG